jgi:hypothetical protein
VFSCGSILFVVPAFLCFRECAKRSGEVTVFIDSAGESNVVLFTDKPTPQEFRSFVHSLKAAITRSGGGKLIHGSSLGQQLHELARLRSLGDLSEEEFIKAKAMLLQAAETKNYQQRAEGNAASS